MENMEQRREYVFYSGGFFGYGERGDFVPWSIWHIIPLLVIAAAIFLIWRYREQLRNWKHEYRFRCIFAFVMLLAEMSYFWRILYIGNEWGLATLMDKLPLQVCQWGLICAVFALMSDSDTLFGINFFVTICLTLPALFVPAVIIFTGPRYFRYYQFWLEHGLPLIAVFYMIFVREKRPKYWHLWLSIGLLTLMSIPCVIANRTIPGANYMYLGNFTESNVAFTDPLSFLPNSQLPRYLSLLALTLTLFHLLYFIEQAIERRVSKHRGTLHNHYRQ